ncbi:MAG: sugar ABC transporter substrate-binding protein [Lachnospiraceae bacterium]|nr:sugar ABC transporter substrate-binding protein [Lachnospiraceae bacterium]
MKKKVAWLLSAVLVLGLCACAGGKEKPASQTAEGEQQEASQEASGEVPKEEESGDKPYIIMVNALNGHPVYEQQAEAARKAAEDYGVHLEIIGPSMGSATVIQDNIAAMENAITLKPDAIICEPYDPTLFQGVKQATEAGIPVFCTSNVTDDENDYITCIGTENFTYGETAVDMIAEVSGGEANILAVLGNLTTTNQVEMLNGMKSRIEEKYPDIKIVDAVADDNDLSKAVALFQDNFNTYPEIDTVVMLEATGGPGAAQVAREMKKEVRILDIDAVEETIDNIIAGDEWATMAQNFFKRGYESVRMAFEYLEAEGNVEFPKYVDSGTVLITQENADTYEEDLWKAITMKGTEWSW